MWSWVKRLFKPKVLSHQDKIKVISKRLPDVYSKECISKYMSVIDVDIVRYNAAVRMILSSKDKEIRVRDLSPDSVVRVTVASWCSEGGRMFKDPSLQLKEFLYVANELLNLADSDRLRLQTEGKIFARYKRYSPYVHNIQDIVDVLYETVKKK